MPSAFYHLASLGNYEELIPNKGAPGVKMLGFRSLLTKDKALNLSVLWFSHNKIGENISTYLAVVLVELKDIVQLQGSVRHSDNKSSG